VILAAVSGGIAWKLQPSFPGLLKWCPTSGRWRILGGAPSKCDAGGGDARVETVGMADAQYDAAVADLEKALKDGRGRLDASTIAIVEHNLQIIDQAINQAREALVADPANSYLSGHLVEARRRKLDLLRRAAALTSETD
jgi:hypothetical protein